MKKVPCELVFKKAYSSSNFIGRCLVLVPKYPRGDSSSLPTASQLEEARGLVRAIKLKIIYSEVIHISKRRPSTFFGKGVVEKFKLLIIDKNIEIVFVDTTLTPIQQRDLEKYWQCKVLDRTGLIIEIFGARAKSKEGVLQVELASLNYQRSRLVRSWTHLERQRGGGGFLGGPGETQIEADRRVIATRINTVKRDLNEVRRTRGLHRKSRERVPYPVVALVGYTNAGKSSIFNCLTASSTAVKNQLFATLDPKMRHLKLFSGMDVIISDTVGFISSLPHELIESFHATLEEITTAQLVLHVRDISHASTNMQKDSVLNVLEQLGLAESFEVPVIEVRNKVDCLRAEEQEFEINRAERTSSAILTSAKTGEGIDALARLIDELLGANFYTINISLPWSQGKTLSWLYERGHVIRKFDTKTTIDLTVKLDSVNMHRLKKMLPAEVQLDYH